MIAQLAYNFGDVCYWIETQLVSDWEICETCDGKGWVTIKKDRYPCPKCHNDKGRHVRTGYLWKVGGAGIVKYAEVQVFPRIDDMDQNNVTYLLDLAGKTTEKAFDEEDLFPNGNMALEECERRNENVRKQQVKF